MTFDAKNMTNGVRTSENRTGHAHVKNIIDSNDFRYRYSQVELQPVR